MKLAKFGWILGGVAAMGLGMAAQACSSSSTTGGDAGGGGTGTGTGTGKPGSSTGSGTGVATGDSGVDAGCHKAPPSLHPETAPGVYCPFEGTGFGANCTAGEHCCEPASGGSACTAGGTACPAANTDWQCGAPVDCETDAGQLLCCGTGTIDMQAPCGAIPAYPYVSGFKGSTCAASCDTGTFNGGMINFIICSQQSDCPSGTCTPIDPKGGGTGYCAGAGTGAGTGTGTGAGTGTGSGTGSSSGTGTGTGSGT